jgi:hypothetical protein
MGGNEKLSITIAPLEVTPSRDINFYPSSDGRNEVSKDQNKPIQYWGIYLDNETISYASSKDHAEKTKEWMEKWLTNKN